MEVLLIHCACQKKMGFEVLSNCAFHSLRHSSCCPLLPKSLTWIIYSICSIWLYIAVFDHLHCIWLYIVFSVFAWFFLLKSRNFVGIIQWIGSYSWQIPFKKVWGRDQVTDNFISVKKKTNGSLRGARSIFPPTNKYLRLESPPCQLQQSRYEISFRF